VKPLTQSMSSGRPSRKACVSRAEEREVKNNLLICGNPADASCPLIELHHEVHVFSEAVQGLEELRTLLQRHSPSLVVFTRASLDRLVARDGGAEPGVSPTSHIEEIWPTLSRVNAQIVELVAKGLRNPEIERATGMKLRTVRAHLSELYRQFDVTNRTELIGALIEAGRGAVCRCRNSL
jgi:DNA-binding CsgD family transcriptional regulator